jgi:hypothetical protein
MLDIGLNSVGKGAKTVSIEMVCNGRLHSAESLLQDASIYIKGVLKQALLFL